ncbi:MAG: YicC family protein [Planctomycetes bacterium RBG_19FT_COMBO_48_8]|nr:MAG: YicC family protein [Planctomycetes bacterium RBG_19FT_COMBO_48_8]
MTGYGEAQGEADGVSYAVEVKTVNNRYLKTIIKLPELASFLEEDIDKLLRKNVLRGTINYVLRLKDASANALFDIDETALQAVAEKLSRAGSSTGINGMIDIGNLLTLPGIIQPALPDKERAGQIKKLVLEISQKALDKLKRMRAIEGDYLEADINKCCTIIEEDLGQVRGRSAIVIKEYADKLQKRVNELLAHAELKIDEAILAREVAIFAERSDISEEVARLDSHLQQFAQCCRGSDQAGRRLDFISQEMLREANTIASKASDTETTRYVVNIKCQIDRIKEQVQNIE